MKIITGRYKGRVIAMPKGIRPTQNKVRKAIFDILSDIEGLSFLELFAGSGAVSFEAASRGASRVALVEENRSAQQAIDANIQALKLQNCQLIPLKAEAAIPSLQRKGIKFDIVFLDPPYREALSKKILQMLDAYDILAPNALVIAQHPKSEKLEDLPPGLKLIKQSRYGDTFLSFYRKE